MLTRFANNMMGPLFHGVCQNSNSCSASFDCGAAKQHSDDLIELLKNSRELDREVL
jgi:hypothetical protein